MLFLKCHVLIQPKAPLRLRGWALGHCQWLSETFQGGQCMTLGPEGHSSVFTQCMVCQGGRDRVAYTGG